MKNKQLRYYQINNINPVVIKTTGKEWELHQEQRKTLYHYHLKLPLSLFDNKKILEFGPNGGEIYKLQNQLLAPVLSKIDAAIQKIGKERGYNYIMDAVSGALVYAIESHDLTNEVIDELRASIIEENND